MSSEQHDCGCPCGKIKFSVTAMPIYRAFCHCTICQDFNKANFADISIFRAKDVNMPDPQLIEYKKYAPPPAARRGKCRACGSATIETIRIFPMPKLVIIPTGNLPEACHIEPSLHAFYHRRIADIDDNLPKYSGFWPSQRAYMAQLARSWK